MAQVLSSVTRSELTSIPSNSLDASVIARYDRYTLGFDFNYPSIQLLRPEINGSNKPSIPIDPYTGLFLRVCFAKKVSTCAHPKICATAPFENWQNSSIT